MWCGMENHESEKQEEEVSTKVGTFDIRQTSQEWIQTIDGLSSEALVFNIIQSLARCPAMIKVDNHNNKVKCSYSQEDLVYYALEKYISMVGEHVGVKNLLMRFSESDAKELQKPEKIRINLLPLFVFIIDFIHRRQKRHELNMLQLFLNAYKHYCSQYSEMVKIKVAETYALRQSLSDTEIMRASTQDDVSGVIDGDK